MTGSANSSESTHIPMESNSGRWIFDNEVQQSDLLVSTCSAYAISEQNENDGNEKCQCGRLRRCHSFIGDPKKELRDKKFSSKFLKEQKFRMHGTLANGSKVSVSGGVQLSYLNSKMNVKVELNPIKNTLSLKLEAMFWLYRVRDGVIFRQEYGPCYLSGQFRSVFDRIRKSE